MRFSVVVPADNEERHLPRCLDAIATAAAQIDHDTEVVVAANRCTDATPAIARRAGAIVVPNEARNIAAVRNAAVERSSGEYLVTIDADCVMAPNALGEVGRLLDTGRYVGGGTRVIPERTSIGIRATHALVTAMTLTTRLSGAMFWCRRADFDAVHGFDEKLLVAEDLDFARRLRAYGKRTNRRFTQLRAAPVVALTRKFDEFGDWHMFKMAVELPAILRAARGVDSAWADRYFFDFNDRRYSQGSKRPSNSSLPSRTRP